MKIEKREVNWNFRFILSSGDEEYPGCKLNISFYKWNITFNLPPITKPDKLEIRGQYNYDEYIERQYGFYLYENHFNIFYGRGDANFNRDIHGEEQRWSCFFPWTEFRMIRHTLYDDRGCVFSLGIVVPKSVMERLDDHLSTREICPKVSFRFKDFDGEEIEATTHIEEREWLRGVGWCEFISLFCKPTIRRSLDIWFSKETGKRKGSYKGGTVGHGIDMLPGELHEEAFKRYCKEHDMTFIDTK